MQKDGTISPPLYPAPSVRAVKRILSKKGELNEELKKIKDYRLLLISKNKEHINQIETFISDFIKELSKFKDRYTEKIQLFYKNQFEIIEKGSIGIPYGYTKQ